MPQLRLNIESEEILNFYKSSEILNHMAQVDRMDQFVVAMSIGYNLGSKTPLNGTRSLILESSISKDNLALLNIVAIADTGDVKVISDKKQVFKIAEQYANTGIKYMQNMEKGAQFGEASDNFEEIVNSAYEDL